MAAALQCCSAAELQVYSEWLESPLFFLARGSFGAKMRNMRGTNGRTTTETDENDRTCKGDEIDHDD